MSLPTLTLTLILACASMASGQLPSGAIDLGKMFQDVNLGGGNSDCAYQCSSGGVPRGDKPGHKPVSNGCGVPGFQVDSKFGMTSCCDKHDHCYHTW